MGRKKEVRYLNGRLAGKFLDEETCRKLEMVIQASKDRKRINNLKNKIFDMSEEDLQTCLVTKSKDHIMDYAPAELTDAQTLGVAFMYYAKRCLIGDSVGVGKTVEFAGVANLIKERYGKHYRFLYLTEKTLANEAREKLTRFTGDYVELLYGEKRFVEEYAGANTDGVLWDTVGVHSLINSPTFQSYLLNFEKGNGYFPYDIVVVDESFVLKNTTTQMWKNCKKMLDKCEFAFMLNATPFENNLMDFYNQIHCLDDTLLPTKTSFSEAYEIKEWNGVFMESSGKYRNEDVFRHQIGYRYFAQTRKNMGAVMENCEAKVIRVPLSSVQRELMSQVSMPQMVYDYPKYFTFNNIKEDSPKIGVLLNLIENTLNDEDTILVYTVYKDVQKDIKESLEWAGISAEYMNGDTPMEVRNNLINGFKNAKFRVLITTVQRGMDFDNCNACVFYSYDPVPSKMVQFEGRMTRSFDIKNKRVFIITTEGRELNRLRKTISDRAKAAVSFAESDFSCVLDLLTDEDWGK